MLAEFQDFRLAEEIFFPRATQEIGFHLRRNGYLGGSQLCHDGQPHRDVGGGHEDLAANDTSRALERRLEWDRQGAFPIAYGMELESVIPRERNFRKDPLQLRFCRRQRHAAIRAVCSASSC